jgi:hypothetical protein
LERSIRARAALVSSSLMKMADETRQALLRRWNKAVTRSIDWEE